MCCCFLRHFRLCLTVLEKEGGGYEMIFFDEDRASDSPYVERVWRCHSEAADPFLSIAASRCELVVSRLEGKVTVTVRGPETRATLLGDCPGGGEWFGILLK